MFTPPEPNGPFDIAAWPDVPADGITYWRPGTLGDALFKYGD